MSQTTSVGRAARLVRFCFFLSTVVAAVAAPQAAFAADSKSDSSEKTKVAVGSFDGAKSDEVRSAFIESLKKDGHYDVTDAEDVKGGKASDIASAAKGLDVDAVVVGKVSKTFNLKVKVYGADGKELDSSEIKGGALPKLKAAVESGGADSISDGIGKLHPAAKKADKDKDDGEKKDEPAAEEAKSEDSGSEASASASTSSGGGSTGLSPFDIMAGLRPMHRTWEFKNTIADARPNEGYYQLLKYELPLGPVLFLDLNFYPGSFVAPGPAEWFGITGGFEKGFATSSVYQEGTPNQKTLKTNEQQFYVGPRVRIPIGEHLLGATFTYGQHTFALEGDETGSTGPLVPDVKYSYVKAGLDGTLRFGDFMFGAHVAKRFVMDTGSLQVVWFPPPSHVKTTSLEAGGMVGYRLVDMLDLVAGFDWLRYAFDFNPNPIRTDPKAYSFVAGGAVDEYLTGYIAFRFHVPGANEKSSE